MVYIFVHSSMTNLKEFYRDKKDYISREMVSDCAAKRSRFEQLNNVYSSNYETLITILLINISYEILSFHDLTYIFAASEETKFYTIKFQFI